MPLDSIQQGEKEELWKRILSIVAYLLFWVIFSAVGLWLMLQLRDLLVQLLIIFQFNPWAVRGYDRLGIFVLGLGWFISMIWIEHYLRTGSEKRRLWRNILRVAAVQAALAAFVLVARFLITL